MGSICSGMVALVFPGQGSQYVGMGKDFYETVPRAREIFQIAEEKLGFELGRLCFSGPREELALTENCQPAVLTTSIACWEALKDSVPEFKVGMVAGHSLGEFSSLVAAESMTFGDTVRLVRRRGLFMAESARNEPGGMVAIIGLDTSRVKEICGNTVTLANLNCPGQIVASGGKGAIHEIIPQIKKAGGKAIPLPVSGAFHSPLMETAAERFREELNKAPISRPAIPVIANVSADSVTTFGAVRESLRRQITSTVRWEESIRRMIAEGVNTFVEVGPGKVLSKLIARIDKSVRVTNVEDRKTLEETLNIV